jgi:hypothetical protein
MRLGIVMNACNSRYVGGRDKRIEVQGQPGRKLARLYLKNTSQVWWGILVILTIGEAEVDLGLRPAPGKSTW